MKKLYFFSALLLTGLLTGACSSDDKEYFYQSDTNLEDEVVEAEEGTVQTTTTEIYYANIFARDMLSSVYLWSEEIADDLDKLDPYTNEDPISTVKEIRYKENGSDVDKWTTLTDDYDSFSSSVAGVETTFGYGLMIGTFSNTGNYFLVISHVYAGSPAEEAGLKRGDIIVQLDGADITSSNYTDALYNSSITLTMGVVEGNTISLGETVSLTAVTMYENPILCSTTFDCNGKLVGYIAYESFDMVSLPELVSICQSFKSQGVSELILDLRYNGGGYVVTETAIASMLAPESVVKAKSVLLTQVWNATYTAYYKQNGTDTSTYFSQKFSVYDEDYNVISVSTANANIGIDKLYAIVTGSSASASEALLVGLMPYMDVELIGENTYGKYCTGYILAADDVYSSIPDELDNWGIYVMVSRFADCNGDNPCMPDGIAPDIEAEDSVLDGYQLGDENETMLKAALTAAGKTDFAAKTRTAKSLPDCTLKFVPARTTHGMLIGNRPGEALTRMVEE